MAEIVRASILEMDLIHKQEEIERMELEQALALSLLVEEERLEILREEAKELATSSIDDKSFYRDDFKDSTVTGSKEVRIHVVLIHGMNWNDDMSPSHRSLKLVP